MGLLSPVLEGQVTPCPSAWSENGVGLRVSQDPAAGAEAGPPASGSGLFVHSYWSAGNSASPGVQKEADGEAEEEEDGDDGDGALLVGR
jgi:hypothetical protein